jgi:hypothetical protein
VPRSCDATAMYINPAPMIATANIHRVGAVVWIG